MGQIYNSRKGSTDNNRLGIPSSNRVSENIDSVMNLPSANVSTSPAVYRQVIADSYHDIESKSNSLNDLGYHVVSVTPILSGRFVILGRK